MTSPQERALSQQPSQHNVVTEHFSETPAQALPNNTDRSIKLLHLQPGDWLEPLVCTLTTADLEDDPRYEALSYVWGAKTSSHPLFIDGVKKSITANLCDALRRLRQLHKDVTLVLWIDAVCIDQTDLNGKARQVAIMGDIYSKSQRVLLWHGEDPYSSVASPDMEYVGSRDPSRFDANRINLDKVAIESLRSRLVVGKALATQEKYVVGGIMTMAVLSLLAKNAHVDSIYRKDSGAYVRSADMVGMEWFQRTWYTRAWFSRLWVVQEAVLAPEARVYIGPFTISLDTIAQARTNFLRHSQAECCLGQGKQSQDHRQSLRGVLERYMQIVVRRENRAKRDTLFRACLTFVDRSASVPHDRVYALLKLTDDGVAVTPNYEQPLHVLYLRVTAETILKEKSTWPLVFAGSQERELKHLPTWAVNWLGCSDHIAMYTTMWRQVVLLYKAGGSRGCLVSPMISSVGNTLSVLGRRIGRVERMATKHSIYPFWQYLMRSRKPDDIYLNGKSRHTWRKAWWRSLCGDACFDNAYAKRISEAEVVRFARGYCDEDPEMKSHKDESMLLCPDYYKPEEMAAEMATYESMRTVSRAMSYSRVLFTSEEGHLGLITEWAHNGDEIFIIPGCPAPLVLRRKLKKIEFVSNDGSQRRTVREYSKEDASQHNVPYQLIGAAYVHGVMDGEQAPAGHEAYDFISIV